MHYIPLDAGPAADQRTILFPIPSDEQKRILISVSGGADSAIMLYILSLYNRDLNLKHEIVPLTVNKVDGAEIHSRKVIKWISEKLGVQIPQPIIGGDHSLPHDKIVNQLLMQKLRSGEYDYIYIGENKIPPIPFPFGEDNDFAGLAPVRKGNPNRNEKIVLPFSDLYKYHTIDLYFRLGVEELLEFTHTCTERAIGRCEKCWQCGERRWSFKQLLREDNGLA